MSSAPHLLLVHSVEVAPAELLADPLAYLFAEHWRHRQFCRALEDASNMPAVPPGLLRRMVDFLRIDMALHVRDEEEDLFPLLRLRTEPDDDIERILGLLHADHDADRSMGLELRQQLEAAADAGAGPAACPGLTDMIGRFVAHKQRHIALENGIALPLARLRLTQDDQAILSRAMAARRAA